MIIYHVKNDKNQIETNEALFIETLSGIYLESPGIGFIKHPTFKTPQDLKQHLKKLKDEGYKVTKTARTAKAFYEVDRNDYVLEERR